jgi:hypothetical protein
MARPTFYEMIGVSNHATTAEIAAAVRERLATTWGDERELIINAANTLLDQESRESYDRLNGIARTRGPGDIALDNAAELAKYAEVERLRRVESAFAELKWTLNFLGIALFISAWLVFMFYYVPIFTVELDRILIANPEVNPVIAGIILTIPSFILGYFILNIFSETFHVMIRYLIVCSVLGAFIWGAGRFVLDTEWLWCAQGGALIGILLGTVMFARYLGVRQLRDIGSVRPSPSRRRDQH